MKKISFFLATLLMAFTFAACGSDDDDVTGNGGEKKPDDNPAPSAIVNMKVSVLMDADQADQAVPRLVAEWGDNMFAQVIDPNHPEVMMFQYLNSDKNDDVVAVLTEHNIIFMNYNPTSGKDFPEEALVSCDYDGFSTISACTIDWEKGDIKFTKTVPFYTQQYKAKTRMATRGENDLIKKPFFDMFDEMSANISKIKDKMKVFGAVGKSATLLCDIWTEGLIPVMKYQLYDDDKLAQQQYVKDYFTGKAMDYVKDKVNGKVDAAMDKTTDYLCEITGVKRKDVNLCVWMYDNLYRPSDTAAEKPTDKMDQLVSSGMQAAMDFSEKVVAADPVFNEEHETPDEDDEVWWDEDDEDDDDDEFGDGDDDDDDDDDDDEGDDNGGGADLIAWYDTKWTFTGTLTTDDTEDGRQSGSVTFTVEFPESGGVKIGGELAEVFGEGTTRYEETRTGVIITNRGTSNDNDSDGTYTETWSYTLTLNHTDATHATADFSGQSVWNGTWIETIYKNGKKTGTESHPYSGATTFSGTFSGTLVK